MGKQTSYLQEFKVRVVLVPAGLLVWYRGAPKLRGTRN